MKRITKILKVFLLSVSIGLISACSGYGGGQQVVGESEHVDTSNYIKISCAKGLSIHYIPKSVENSKMAAIKHFIKPGWYRVLRLPPGEHSFELVLKDRKRRLTHRVNVMLKPNMEYKASYQAQLFSADFWILNVTTGKIIYDSRKP